MESISERIRTALDARKMKQIELSEKSGVDKGALSSYISGRYQPKQKNIIRIAKALNVSEAWLMGHDVPMERFAADCYTKEWLEKYTQPVDTEAENLYRIPILGYVSAGLPLYAEEHIEGYTYTDLNGGAEYFALKIKGDSMNNARICDGDTVIVRKQPVVENGEIAVVIVDNENATVKKFYQHIDTVTLIPQSANPQHQPQVYSLRETPIRILGKVVRNEITF